MSDKESPESIPIYCAYDKLLPIDELKPNPKNNNIHPDEQIKLLAKLIENHGWRIPVTVSNLSGFIVRGHGKLMAARLLGAEVIPVDFQDYKDNAQELADLMADNKIPELSLFDDDLTKELLSEIKKLDADFDMELTGFSDEELNVIFDLNDPPGPVEGEDDIPEPPAEPKSKLGDLYQLGRHRLLCGDSTKREDVERLLIDNIRTIITSPPYFNARDYAHWETIEDYITDMVQLITIASNFAEDLCIVWNIGEQPVHRMDLSSLTSVAFSKIENVQFRDKIAWIKPGAAFDIPRNGHIIKGYYYPAFSWEPLLIFTKGDHPLIEEKYRNELSKDCTDTWEIETVTSQNEKKGFHSAAYPVALAKKCIKCYSPNNSIIYEPFCGSGTTIIAAEEMGRDCYAMELGPVYIDVIISRWETFTGQKAVKL